MKTAPLGAIAEIVSGATPKTGIAEYWDGDVKWATPADLSKLEGAYISTTPRKITQAGVRSCATTILPEGSVLLSSRAPIGHVAINTVPMATNQGFKSLVPGPELNSKFLYHWLKSKTDYLQSLGNGATFKELSKKTTEQIQVPLPPLAEQHRVAAILDHADALRAKRRQVHKLLDSAAQAVFQQMFGHLKPDAQLQSVCTRVTDGTHQSPQWTDAGVPFLFVSNITSGEIDMRTKKFIGEETWADLTRRAPIEVGDVLYSTVGSYGIPAVVRTQAHFAFQRHIAHIKPNPEEIDSDFLAAQLASPTVARQAKRAARGVAQPTVNLVDIKKFSLIVPPITEQRSFAAIAENLRAKLVTVVSAARRDDELFAALQSRAFRGEL